MSPAHTIRRRSRAALIAALAAVCGCAVGPNFHRPAPPADRDYGSAPSQGTTAAAAGTGGGAQTFAGGMDIPAQWWTLFQSPKLNALVEQSLKGNPNIDAARAALRQAQLLYKAQRASLLPTVQGGFDATRAKNAVDTLANPTSLPQVNPYYNLYTAQLNLSYMPDVFGGTRRALEGTRAEVEATRFELIATYVTLSSNVVATAVQEAALRGQIGTTQRLLELQHQLTETLRQQHALGTASNVDLLPQEALEAQTAATLPPLQKQLGQTRDALTALLGRLPAGEPADTFELDRPDTAGATAGQPALEAHRAAPRRAPGGSESARRIGGRRRRARQHAAAVRRSAPRPASAALKIGQLFSAYTGFWDVGASLTQTLFDAGALRYRHRAADAALDAGRCAVPGGGDPRLPERGRHPAGAAGGRRSAQGERRRPTGPPRKPSSWRDGKHEIGTLSTVALLNAEQTYQQAEIALVQAQANRYADTAGLFQALGGGWWNLPEATFK